MRKLPTGGAHWTRDIAFSPDDKTMFVSVGSATNDAEGVRAARRASCSARSWDVEDATAPTCWPSIPTAGTSASSRPACATAPA